MVLLLVKEAIPLSKYSKQFLVHQPKLTDFFTYRFIVLNQRINITFKPRG